MNLTKQPPVMNMPPADEDTRRLAHTLWIQSHKPNGNDWAHWFEAQKLLQQDRLQVLAREAEGTGVGEERAQTCTAPVSRAFRYPYGAHDQRIDVAAGGALQRRRARHTPRAEPLESSNASNSTPKIKPETQRASE